MNELLREAQKVYLRREEEKTKTKAKIMVAIARESTGFGRGDLKGDGEEKEKMYKQRKQNWDKIICYYCGEEGHTKRNCKRKSLDEVIAREQDTLEKILKEND